MLVAWDDFRSVMTVTLDDVVADEPTEGAADQHIGGKVILAHYASESDTGGPGVEQDLGPAGRVFFSERGRG